MFNTQLLTSLTSSERRRESPFAIDLFAPFDIAAPRIRYGSKNSSPKRG